MRAGDVEIALRPRTEDDVPAITEAKRETLGARVQLLAEPANRGSRRVAENAGFRREGLLGSYVEIKGDRRDVYLYALLRDDL